MKRRNNSEGLSGPLSFIKGVKDKIMGTVFRESPEDEIVKKLNAAEEEIAGLKANKEDLRSRWLFLMKGAEDAGLIRAELRKISDEKRRLQDEISRNEEKVRALVAGKDSCFKAQEAARVDLKRILEEKRAIQDDAAMFRKKESEMQGLKNELAEARSREESSAGELEEVGIKLRFASANMDTLILDSTIAKKTLDDLKEVINTKEEAIESDQNMKSAVDEAAAKLDELKSIKDGAGDIFHTAEADLEKLKKIREALKDVEGEHSAIPKRIAELSASGGGGAEKAELLKKEKSLADEIERLNVEKKKITRQAQKNKTVLEEAKKALLDLKRFLISAGLKEYIAKVDSPDILKRDIDKKSDGLARAISSLKKELAQAKSTQSQKRSAVTRMTEEIDKLMKDASRDKRDVELQAEKLKRIKDESTSLRKDLEQRLREKGTAVSELVTVNTEMKRVENLEAGAIGMIGRIEAEVRTTDGTLNTIMRRLEEQKRRVDESAGSEEFFRERLGKVEELESLRTARKELELSREVAAKHEKDLKRYKEMECRKTLLEAKLALIDESPAPVPVMESRLSEMRKEASGLEEGLAPLRSELDLAFEKKDNVEMEISFAAEARKKAEERTKSLERKLDFITKESGSVKNIQDKLTACESRLTDSRGSIAEIQTRLNFTSATEETIKENLRGSEDALKKIDKEISVTGIGMEEKEASLSDARARLSDCEKKLEGEKSARIGSETDHSALATELKKTVIECDALDEKTVNLGAALKENKDKLSAIENVMPSYNANLEKDKKLGAKIEGMNESLKSAESQMDSFVNQVSDLQAKKRELMDNMLGSPGETTKKVSGDKKKVDALRSERKSVRGEIKKIEEKIKELNASSADESGADKEKSRAALDSLRKEREALHENIERINERMDAAKKGGKTTESVKGNDKAKELAQAIGEMDIKVLTLTKSVDRLTVELESKREDLKKAVDKRNELELEIESQKNMVRPLDEIKKKIQSLEKESGLAAKSLEDKSGQKELLAKKAEEVEKKSKAIARNIEDAESGRSQAAGEIKAAEKKTGELKEKFDNAVKDKERTYAEFRRLKDEMDSIMRSNRQDRETIDSEKTAAENARKEVEYTKKQLADVMSILTGKAGSIDELKLGLISSREEAKDISDRIDSLRMEFKLSMAAIEGVESDIKPKAARVKYLKWADGAIDKILGDIKLRAEFKKVSGRLKELEEARDLFDEYNDLSKTKEEMTSRVGELKSRLELEAQVLTAEQARREAMAMAGDNAQSLEEHEAMSKSLEEKYKDSQEDKVQMKGMLDDVTRQFESAKARWGNIEDLSRIKESLESKIHLFRDDVGDMEKVSGRADRLESEKTELARDVNGLAAKCRALEKDRDVLKASLAKSKAEFNSAFVLVKKSRDEARKFLSSKA